jgi:hypothetical protein
MDYAILLLIPACFLAGWLGQRLQNRSLQLRTYSLECSVTDLQQKLVVEVKRRAGYARQDDRRLEEEILKAAGNAKPGPTLPWWAAHVKP